MGIWEAAAPKGPASLIYFWTKLWFHAKKQYRRAIICLDGVDGEVRQRRSEAGGGGHEDIIFFIWG